MSFKKNLDMLFKTLFFSDVQKVTKLPVIIGSGVTINNINEFVTADGVIVGSHFKHNGHWSGQVDSKRVSIFMEAIQKFK